MFVKIKQFNLPFLNNFTNTKIKISKSEGIKKGFPKYITLCATIK